MISFVWSSRYPFWAGAGGSENYTAGQIRELQRRGIPTRVLTIGHGLHDGRWDFPDITFKALPGKQALSLLNDTLVFVTYPLHVRTKRPSYAIMHCPPESAGQEDSLFDKRGFNGKQLIAASRFSALMWEKHLGLQRGAVPVAYPFADQAFAAVKRPKHLGRKTRVLFSGRLHPDKGIYTLLASLHIMHKMGLNIELTATTAGARTDDGAIVHRLLEAHPMVKLVPSGHDASAVARLMARHDVVVMPSTGLFWKELFGMVSVEAQHAGCRVVASDSGGLPETDSGGLLLVKPDDPKALAEGLAQAVALGPLTTAERKRAANVFTVEESVDQLLDIMGQEVLEPRSKQRLTTPLLKPSLSTAQPVRQTIRSYD